MNKEQRMNERKKKKEKKDLERHVTPTPTEKQEEPWQGSERRPLNPCEEYFASLSQRHGN